MRIAYDGIPFVGARFGIGDYTDRLIRALAPFGRGTCCVVVCPWPIDPLRALPALSPLGPVRGASLLFLGPSEPRKNLGRLLDAVVKAGADVGPIAASKRSRRDDDAPAVRS